MGTGRLSRDTVLLPDSDRRSVGLGQGLPFVLSTGGVISGIDISPLLTHRVMQSRTFSGAGGFAMAAIVQRFTGPWIRAVTTGVIGAGIVTGIFILAGGWVSERVVLVALIYSGTIAGASALVLPWVERAETGLMPIAQRLVVAGTFIGIAALGAVAAGGVVLATGLVPAERSRYVMTSGLGIALLVAVLLFSYEMGRERRVRAERALRDEAARRHEAERLATEARLKSLESRLEPHFLFNALTTIAHWIIADPPRAERLVEQLADLLRASLQRATTRTVPLGQELKAVLDLLQLEEAQLGDQLRWSLPLLRDLRGCEVPPFSLQSLVQNSVKHVAAARPEGAEINVDGEIVDDRLTLSVWDDGPGFDLAQAPAGHGLHLLRQQLAALYGDQAGLAVRREDGGTRVVMWLPATDEGRIPA
jgi:signal transduction histidine kinase